MKSLLEFHQDTDTKNNVHEYLVQFFKEEAVRRLMERENAVALADAVDLTNKAFENMDILFSKKVEGKELKNEAR